jgi:hypothetical protein
MTILPEFDGAKIQKIICKYRKKALFIQFKAIPMSLSKDGSCFSLPKYLWVKTLWNVLGFL